MGSLHSTLCVHTLYKLPSDEAFKVFPPLFLDSLENLKNGMVTKIKWTIALILKQNNNYWWQFASIVYVFALNKKI